MAPQADAENDEEPAGEPAQVVVPWQRLSEGALRGVIEEFVTREGTEYGAQDVDLEAKVTSVRRQLERGEIVVLFDGETSSVNLVTSIDLERLGLEL